MTIEQITAINNAMSMLSNLYEDTMCMASVKSFKEHTDRHIKALKDAGVDKHIIDHLESLIKGYLTLAQNAEEEHMKYENQYMRDLEWEKEMHYKELEFNSVSHSTEDDLIALKEILKNCPK